MVQAEKGGRASLRSNLIAHLPQFRRFAVVLAGEAREGDALLAMVCGRLVAEDAGCPEGEPFDRWVLRLIYSHWLGQVRQRRQPISELQADAGLFGVPMAAWGQDRLEVEEIAAFLAGLPPQQRAAALLVYGQGYSYEEAGQVLEVGAEAVAGRVARALGSLVDRLDLAGGGRAGDADLELHREQEQAGA